jgi:cyclic pyranopterin monophosphate synthase
MAWCPRFASRCWTLTWVQKDSPRAASYCLAGCPTFRGFRNVGFHDSIPLKIWNHLICFPTLSPHNAVRYPFMPKLSHYDRNGRARMVDVSAKSTTRREAEASAFVAINRAVLKALPENPKGDPLEVARLAGIMAAKKTSDLIPMCHPLPLSHVDVNLQLCENGVAVSAKVTTTAATGVEMEALVAATVAALTVYDMCKALDKGIEIQKVVLERKVGGKSGTYLRSRKKT